MINYISKNLVLISFVIAFLTRFLYLDYLSLNLDEAQSVWQATHSINYIIEYMSKNVHLPLHNTTLHLWMNLFGSSEVSVRLLSAIPGFFSVVALYFLSKEILNKNGVKLATLMGAVSPFWIWYSREIRMYSLLVLFTTLSYFFYIKAFKTGKLYFFILHGLINIIGIYTHYFFGLVLVVQFLFFLIGLYKNYTSTLSKKKLFTYYTISALIVIGAFTPWVYKLLFSTGIAKFGPELEEPEPFNVALSFYQFVFGYQSIYITTLGVSLWPLIMLFLFLFLTKKHRPSNFIPLLFIASLVPVLLTYFLSITIKPIYLTRYTSTASPMFIILLAWLISEFKPKVYMKILSIIFFNVLVIASILQYTSSNNDYHENYRGVKQYLEKNTTYTDIIAVAPAYTLYPMQYYYNGQTKMVSLPLWDKKKGSPPQFNDKIMDKDLQLIAVGHKKLYYIATLNLQGSHLVKTYLDKRFKKIDKIDISKNIQINIYDIEYLSSGEININ